MLQPSFEIKEEIGRLPWLVYLTLSTYQAGLSVNQLCKAMDLVRMDGRIAMIKAVQVLIELRFAKFEGGKYHAI